MISRITSTYEYVSMFGIKYVITINLYGVSKIGGDAHNMDCDRV
jgi:hypothetical protein